MTLSIASVSSFPHCSFVKRMTSDW